MAQQGPSIRPELDLSELQKLRGELREAKSEARSLEKAYKDALKSGYDVTEIQDKLGEAKGRVGGIQTKISESEKNTRLRKSFDLYMERRERALEQQASMRGWKRAGAPVQRIIRMGRGGLNYYDITAVGNMLATESDFFGWKGGQKLMEKVAPYFFGASYLIPVFQMAYNELKAKKDEIERVGVKHEKQVEHIGQAFADMNPTQHKKLLAGMVQSLDRGYHNRGEYRGMRKKSASTVLWEKMTFSGDTSSMEPSFGPEQSIEERQGRIDRAITMISRFNTERKTFLRAFHDSTGGKKGYRGAMDSIMEDLGLGSTTHNYTGLRLEDMMVDLSARMDKIHQRVSAQQLIESRYQARKTNRDALRNVQARETLEERNRHFVWTKA